MSAERSAAVWRVAAVLMTLVWLATISLSWWVTVRAGDEGLLLQASSFAPRPVLGRDMPVPIVGVSPGSAAKAAGIQPRDLLISVDGVPAGDTAALRALLYSRRAGDVSTVRIRPQGRAQGRGLQSATAERDISLVLESRIQRPRALTAVISYAAAGALVVLVAASLIFFRPNEIPARVLLVIGTCGGLWQAVDASYGGLRERWLPLGWDTLDQLGYLVALANAIGVLHLFLVFPSPHLAGRVLALLARTGAPGALLQRRPIVAALALYLVPLGLVASLFLAHQSPILLFWSSVVVIFGLGIVALTYNYVRPATPIARAQIRWIIVATFISLLVIFAGPAVEVFGGGRNVLVGWPTVVMVWGVVHLSLALAILRYRLFDVSTVLRTTLLYPLLALLLGVGYVSAGFTLGWLASLLAGQRVDETTVRVLAALVVAAGFHPLRIRLREALDMLLNPERRAVAQFLAEASETLARARPAEEVEELLTERASAMLGLTGAWLIREPGSVTGTGIDPDMAPADLVVAGASLLANLRTVTTSVLLGPPVLVRSPVPMLAPDAPETAPWYALGARLLVPLRASDRLVALWALGQRKTFELPDRQELASLDRVTRTAAALLDYARLHEEYLTSQLAAQKFRLEQERLNELEHLHASVQEERATLTAVMESMQDGLLVTDAAHTVRYCNSRAMSLLGVPRAAIVGHTADEALAAALRQSRADEEGAADGDTPGTTRVSTPLLIGESAEITLPGPTRRDIRLEWFLVYGPANTFVELSNQAVIGSEGALRRRRTSRKSAESPENALLGYGLLMRDVTAERTLERAKDEFTSMISHELRTPIGIIKGFAATLLHDTEGDIPAEDREESLRLIVAASDQLTQLVANLLDMSLLRAGAFTMTPRPVAPGSMIVGVVQQMRVARNTHTLRVDLSPDLPPVLADAVRVEQVLRNLVDNAMKYSPNGSTVLVEAFARDVRADTAGEDDDSSTNEASRAISLPAPGTANEKLAATEVVVRVTDEGDGIPPEEQARLFETYRRGPNARSRGVAGSGLGLAISRRLVEAHGGRIWVESPVRKHGGVTAQHGAARRRAGTRVCFTLRVTNVESGTSKDQMLMDSETFDPALEDDDVLPVAR